MKLAIMLKIQLKIVICWFEKTMNVLVLLKFEEIKLVFFTKSLKLSLEILYLIDINRNTLVMSVRHILVHFYYSFIKNKCLLK